MFAWEQKSWWSCDEGRLRGMLNVSAQVRRAATLAKWVDADWRKRQTGNPEELLEDRKIITVKKENWKEQAESVILSSPNSPTHITQHSSQFICLKYLGQLCQYNYCGTILWNKSTNRSELKISSSFLFRWLQMNEFFPWVILKDNVLQHKPQKRWRAELFKVEQKTHSILQRITWCAHL